MKGITFGLGIDPYFNEENIKPMGLKNGRMNKFTIQIGASSSFFEGFVLN